MEKRHILATLEKNHGNRTVTAQELGISLRKLYYRLGQYQREGHSRRREWPTSTGGSEYSTSDSQRSTSDTQLPTLNLQLSTFNNHLPMLNVGS